MTALLYSALPAALRSALGPYAQFAYVDPTPDNLWPWELGDEEVTQSALDFLVGTYGPDVESLFHAPSNAVERAEWANAYLDVPSLIQGIPTSVAGSPGAPFLASGESSPGAPSTVAVAIPSSTNVGLVVGLVAAGAALLWGRRRG